MNTLINCQANKTKKRGDRNEDNFEESQETHREMTDLVPHEIEQQGVHRREMCVK